MIASARGPGPPGGSRTAGLVAGLASLAVYVLTTSHTVSCGDDAEFQAIAAVGGIAHAGYPVLVMALRLFGRLPLGSMAFRANLLSCVSGALAAGLAAALGARLTRRPWAGILAGLALAFSRVAWSESTHAGVHAFTLALDGLLFLSLVRFSRRGGGAAALASGVLLGLALLSHLTSLALVPVVVAAGALAARRGRLRAAHAALLALGLGIGLAPLATLLAQDRPGQPMNYIEDTLDMASGQHFPAGTPRLGRVQRAAWLLSARQYLANSPFRPFRQTRRRLGYLAADLVFNSLLPLGALLGLAGLAARARRGCAEAWLLLAWLAGLVLLVLAGASFEMTPIFFLPGLWILAVGLAEALAHPGRPRAVWAAFAFAAVLAAPVARLLAPGPPAALRAHGVLERAWELWPGDWSPFRNDAGWDRYGRDVMARLEPRAVVLVCWKQATTLRYFQCAERLRPDVDFVYTCRHPERVRLALARARAAGRPACCTLDPAGLDVGPAEPVYASPQGGLWRLGSRPGPR